jgi:hypothetical protein
MRRHRFFIVKGKQGVEKLNFGLGDAQQERKFRNDFSTCLFRSAGLDG